MSLNQLTRQSRNTTFPLCWVVLNIALYINNAHAGMEDDFRRQLIKEVSSVVEDKSLVDGIVEIRFRREFDKWRGSNSEVTTSSAISLAPNLSALSTDDALNELSKRNFGSSVTANAGIGSVGFFGFSVYVSPNVRLRTDLNAYKSTGKSQTINGSAYVVDKSNYSLGTYVDWYPTQNGFKLVAGINVNRIQHKVKSTPNSAIAVNSKVAPAGDNYLDITYKFPKVTPFIGIGYESGTGNDYGWNGVAEIGVMIGRYDADVKTNLLGESNITLQDLQLEVDANRSALFKSRYQPVAKIGLKYGY